MIIDFKYHVTTLVSVFMALGIGIVIGSLIVGESFVTTVVNEQESIVQKLEGEYQIIKNEAKLQKDEMNALKKTNDYYKQYINSTLPKLIGGCLTGTKIAVVDNQEVQAPEYLLNNLRLGGAEILLQHGLPEVSEIDISLYETVRDLDAIILVSKNISERKSVKEVQAFIKQSFVKERPAVYNLIIGTRDDSAPAALEHDEIYYLDSIDPNGSISELVQLIFNIAEDI